MHKGNLLILLIFFSFYAIGCSKESTPTSDENPPIKIEKSPKRGLAYDLTNSADLDTLKSGVAWWYNWGTNTKAPSDYYSKYQMEFIPMLWGGNTSGSDIALTESFIINHPEIKYLLVMNEPNLTDQANRTPEQAAADWLKYEQVINDLAARKRDNIVSGPRNELGNYGKLF